MLPFVSAAGIAFGAIFVAEFGDKSQLLVLGFATRHPWRPIVAGLVLAAALVQGLSVAVGTAVGAMLPDTLVAVVAGIAFLGVAAWTLRDDDHEHEGGDAGASAGSRVTGLALVATVAATFALGEIGDKTMLATFALAASQGPLPTWIGATAAMVAANLVAVVVGRQLGTRLSDRAVRIGSATLFAIAGIAILAGVLVGGG